MKEQRGIKTSRFEEKVQMNTIVYHAFKNALRAGLDAGIDSNLPIYDFLAACDLHPDRGIDQEMRLAYDVIVRGKPE
jgi:hypothetical protein